MQNNTLQNLLQLVGQGLSQSLIHETNNFNCLEEQLFCQSGHEKNNIEKLLCQYQRMLIYIYSVSANQYLQQKINQILSAHYSFQYFDHDLKCYIASFRYLLLFVTEIPYVIELITQLEGVLYNIPLDTYISRRVLKLRNTIKLREHLYSKIYQKKTLNLNYFTNQTINEQIFTKRKQDYAIPKFSFKKQTKNDTPQYHSLQTSYPYQTGQQLSTSQPPQYWPQQEGPKPPPQQIYSVPFPPYAPFVPMSSPRSPPFVNPPLYPTINPPQYPTTTPPMNPPMAPQYSPPMYHLYQQLNVTYCPMPPKAELYEPQQQYTFNPELIQNPMTDSIYQNTHPEKEPMTDSIYQKTHPEKEFAKQELSQQELQQPQPEKDNDAYQASILAQKMENVQIEQNEEVSEVEQLLLKRGKQSFDKHDILSLTILADFLNGKMQKQNWAARRKEMQTYFDF